MKEKIRKIVLVILVILLGICCYKVGSWYFGIKEESKVTDDIVEEAKEQNIIFDRNMWNELKTRNSDFVGYIHLEDDSMNLPIMQSSEEYYYYRRDFNKNYSTMGTPYVDTRANTESDGNTTIYGHHVMYMDSAMFSPLLKLKQQENYENCKTFTIWWEHYQNTYEIVEVYIFDEKNADTYAFNQRNFYNEEEFNTWIDYAEERNLIKTDSKAEYGKQYASLMTCNTANSTERLIVIGKLVDQKEY